ncbi:MAG: tRNA (N6-threonylcarbamoyladenosine(37)-N6)-methyltransferase TrmO [Bacteroidetes bacterium 4484_249]|nr:MAG: tRNA (N6-threonylcarbamoyladenosine(37)-N6)-methyltransferase TrmO [Bacteroidetes bacterium 4484_249]
MEIKFNPIGIIHTPFKDDTPFSDFENAEGEFFIELDKKYEDGLYLLDKFKYLYILFHIDRPRKKPHLRVTPPRGDGREVGLFATRSPHRFNSIGQTIAKIKKIEKNIIYTSGLDILDNTPLIDIKPYVRDFDMKEDSNTGWIKFDK